MAETDSDHKKTYNSISRYCDYQDRCIQEVRKKLLQLGIPESEWKTLIDRLVNNDLINEERYAMSYARGKFRIKNWGRIRIKRELLAKGITTVHISNALEAIDAPLYQQTLHDLALKKLESLPQANDPVKRKKLWDALIYRGWEKELVYDKIKELLP